MSVPCTLWKTVKLFTYYNKNIRIATNLAGRYIIETTFMKKGMNVTMQLASYEYDTAYSTFLVKNNNIFSPTITRKNQQRISTRTPYLTIHLFYTRHSAMLTTATVFAKHVSIPT
jgi:hypothetical protein